MDDSINLSHAHCRSCFNFFCTFTDDPVVTCDVVHCELLCGARFHRCKQEEHEKLCSSQRVPCINAVYGCAAQLIRSSISSHLEVCPASVIHCTMEWNRWPVYSSERQSHQPTQILSNTNTDQLDIALALRDQRMLTQSMRASRKTRQILTTSVNRKHPAVPLDKQLMNEENVDEIKELEHLIHSMQNGKTDEEKRRAMTQPGLRDSICQELRRGKLSQEQCTTGGSTNSEYDLPYYPPEVYDAYPYIHCSHCEKRKERLERILGGESLVDDSLSTKSEEDEAMGNTKPRLTEGRLDAAASNGECQEMNGDISDLHGSPTSQLSSCSASSSSDMDNLQPPALFVTSSTTGDLSAAPSRGYAKLLVIQPQNSLSSFGKNSLGLDLSMESITKYQTKPDSMYTFLCAQDFRRDEFANHFKNVHSEIHGGLNGWLEQRCPLAPYGCTYSQRRFFPGVQGAKIVHSQRLESFGLQMEMNGVGGVEAGVVTDAAGVTIGADGVATVDGGELEESVHPDYLSSLPFELLQYLFRFLDSFSLSNTSMVSKLLRQVSSSLLEERGMVVLSWEKKHPTGWEISSKSWLYSTSFTPVHSWGFENYAPIGQHLVMCPYNIRCSYPEKVQVMGKEAPSRKRKPEKEKEINSV